MLNIITDNSEHLLKSVYKSIAENYTVNGGRRVGRVVLLACHQVNGFEFRGRLVTRAINNIHSLIAALASVVRVFHLNQSFGGYVKHLDGVVVSHQ